MTANFVDILAARPVGAHLHIGTVAAVNDNLIDIDIGGAVLTGIPVLRGTTYADGDRATVLVHQQRAIAIGIIQPATPTP